MEYQKKSDAEKNAEQFSGVDNYLIQVKRHNHKDEGPKAVNGWGYHTERRMTTHTAGGAGAAVVEYAHTRAAADVTLKEGELSRDLVRAKITKHSNTNYSKQ